MGLILPGEGFQRVEPGEALGTVFVKGVFAGREEMGLVREFLVQGCEGLLVGY